MTVQTAARSFFSFPEIVNDIAARLVASGVVIMTAAVLVFDFPWLLWVIAFGFLARVATGPKVSPLALLVTRVIEPALPIAPRLTPGPPKRFAQAIGATLSVVAIVFYFAFDWHTAAYVGDGMILVAASLEAFLGFCLGCKGFAILMRLGIIPESVCEACADISRRRTAAP
jgi:hypothetical protein